VIEASAALAALLDRYDTVDLDALESAALLDRIDRKFAVPVAQLPALVGPLREAYRVLTVESRRVATYRTHYFDTPELTLYRRHQSGHVPRLKVRVRDYLDSGQRYFEVKRRANSGRTVKMRIPVATASVDPERCLADPVFAQVDAPTHAASLQPTVLVYYRRSTLVHRTHEERITIDVGVTYANDHYSAALVDLAIIEVKQDQLRASPVIDILKGLGARPLRISKFGMAVACVYPSAPRHRFLPLLRTLAPTITPRDVPHDSLADLLTTR
jgi:hypothetical protein